MLDPDVEEGTAELAAMLRENTVVDPRTIRMRHSILKQMSLSPAHLWYACQQPQDDSLAAKFGAFAADRKEAYRFGTACHLMTLGEEKKVARCSIRRDMRTKQYQAYAAEAEQNGIKVILSEREHFLADAIVTAIRRNELAMRMLFDGTIIEQTIEWEYFGRSFRATPDARTGSRIVDLKTSRSSNPAWFKREALRMHYDTQVRLYSDAAKEATGRAIDECVLVVVEKTPPFPVTVFRFDDEVLERADRILRLWMEQLNVCEASNMWPEYASSIVPIEMDEQEGWAA